jgi:tRNA(fMet)-specific endonuclease VapC
MRYLLDTNICIYIINKKAPKTLERLMRLDPTQVALSSITMHELYYGAMKSNDPEKTLGSLKNFLLQFNVLPWTTLEASVAGQIRAKLAKAGQPIGPYDLLIAAQAVGLGLTLVTNNEREFKRVENLKVENW